MALPLLVLCDSFASHGYLPGSDFDLVKDYLQPAATFALAVAIASLPITLPMGVKAARGLFIEGGSLSVLVTHNNNCAD